MELREPIAGDERRLLSELRSHLPLREEMLRPARHDDLRRPDLSGLDQRIEMLDGTIVCDAERELIEAVKEERDSPLREHMAEGLELDPLDAGEGEVLGDERVEVPRLLQ